MFLPVGPKKSTLNSGFQEGVFLGLHGRSELYVGVAGKVLLARAFKRLPGISKTGEINEGL